MKKRQIWNFLSLVIIVLLMMELAFAIELKTSKDSYYPQETLQAEITGSFISLSPENIAIYEQGVPRPIPVVSELTKQDDVYYFYAILPNKEGNFSVVIENTEYVSEGELKRDNIIKEFIIKKSNQSYRSRNPGFILTSGEFSIKIKGLYKNQQISATLQATNQSKSFNIIESDEKTISFSTSGTSLKRTDLTIGEYTIPVFILKNTIAPGTESLVFSPQELTATVAAGENYFFQISLENFGDKNLTNIRFSNNLNTTISPGTLDLLKKGERKIINISVPIAAKAKNNLSGEITALYGNKSANLKILFKITENKTKVNLNGTTVIPGLSCTGRGKICIYPEKCSKETTESLEGPCCLGDCSAPKPAADYGWIFGLVVLILLGVIAYFFIMRARKKQKIKTSEEILDEKSKKFDERMNPGEEVNGRLGRT